MTFQNLLFFNQTNYFLQVLVMGVDPAKIKMVLKKRIQETGSGFKSANELIDATIRYNQQTSTTNQGATQLPATLSTPIQSSTSQPHQVPLSESHPQPTNLDPNRLTADISNRLAFTSGNNKQGTSPQSQQQNQSSHISIPTAGASAAASLVSAGESVVSQIQPNLIEPIKKDKNAMDASEDLELENRRLKDQRTCKICMDREIGVVFLPCGHLISCVQCAPALKDCPLCRQPIHGTVKTYMS